MKIKSKAVKPVANQPMSKVVKAAKAMTQVVKKAASIVSRFYVQLRGTPLKLANLRKEDFTAQAFSEVPKGLQPAVVIAEGTYGTSVSMVNAKGTVVQVDKGRAFDMKQVKHAKVLHPREALAYFKKHGAAHVIKQGKDELKGITLGSLEDMYVGFVDTATHTFRTLETATISDKRNKANTFSLVK